LEFAGTQEFLNTIACEGGQLFQPGRVFACVEMKKAVHYCSYI